jgi:hypothetical protein
MPGVASNLAEVNAPRAQPCPLTREQSPTLLQLSKCHGLAPWIVPFGSKHHES